MSMVPNYCVFVLICSRNSQQGDFYNRFLLASCSSALKTIFLLHIQGQALVVLSTRNLAQSTVQAHQHLTINPFLRVLNPVTVLTLHKMTFLAGTTTNAGTVLR